jgi:hypothetical protein
VLDIRGGFELCRRFPPLNVSPARFSNLAKAQKSLFAFSPKVYFCGAQLCAKEQTKTAREQNTPRQLPFLNRLNTQEGRGLWKRLWPAELE